MHELRRNREHILACRGDMALSPEAFFRGYGDALGYLPRMVSVLDKDNHLSHQAERRHLCELLASYDGAAPLILLTGATGSGKTVEQLALVHGAMDIVVRDKFSREAERQLPFSTSDPVRKQIKDAINRLGGWAACWVDCSLVESCREKEERSSDRILRLIASLGSVTRLRLNTEQLRNLLLNSPPIVFLFDLNRATPRESVAMVRALKAFWSEFCGPERGGAAHRCVATYRQIGQQVDQVWNQLAPRPDSSKCQAWVLHELAPFEADTYLVRARSMLYETRQGLSASDARVKAQADLPAFQRLSMDFTELVKLPLLLHMASTLQSLNNIGTAKDLYDQFLSDWYDRTTDHPDFTVDTSSQEMHDLFTVFSRRLGLQMILSGSLVLTGQVVLDLLKNPTTAMRWNKTTSLLFPPGKRCSYRSAKCANRRASKRLTYAQYLAHAPLTAHSKKSVEFLHHSFTYHAAGTALREYLGPRNPPDGLEGNALKTWARRAATLLASDPGRWLHTAEFLGGAVNTAIEGQMLLAELLRFPRTTADFPELCRRLLRGMGPLSQHDKLLWPVRRFLEREYHRLHEDPIRLWQELFNELWPDAKRDGRLELADWLEEVSSHRNSVDSVLRRVHPLQRPRLELRRFEGHMDRVIFVSLSSDGRRILTMSDDESARLWNAQTGQLIRTYGGHNCAVTSTCFSPNGRWLLTASNYNRPALLCDSHSGQTIKAFTKHSSPVSSDCFSPNGQWVLTGSTDGAVQLWDAETGNYIRALEGHTKWIRSVCFSPKGRWILTGSNDETARLWDAASGKCIRAFKGYSDWVRSVCFSPDGRWVLATSGDWTELMWDVHTGEEIRAFVGTKGTLTFVCFSDRGQLVLTRSHDNKTRLCNSQTGEEIGAFKGNTGWIKPVRFSPDGRWVLTLSDEKYERLWNSKTGEGLHSKSAFICFSPNGQNVIAVSDDKAARLCDAYTGSEIQTFEGHSKGITSACFSTDGRLVLTGSADQTARLWEAQTGGSNCVFDGHGGRVRSVCFSPNGRWVLTGSGDGTARLWDARTGKLIRSFQGHRSGVTSICFSPDGHWVLSGSEDYTARLWETNTGKEIKAFEGHGGWVRAVCFSRNGQWVLTGSGDDEMARLWDVRTGGIIQEFVGHTDAVFSVCFSSNGRWVLTGSHDFTARLWDIKSGETIRLFRRLSLQVTSVCFAPNCSSVLTGLGDNTARLWPVKTGKRILVFKGHSGWIESACFSPDGQRVLTGSIDKTVRLWDSQAGTEILRVWLDFPCQAVAFSADGKRILAGDSSGQWHLWRIEAPNSFSQSVRS